MQWGTCRVVPYTPFEGDCFLSLKAYSSLAFLVSLLAKKSVMRIGKATIQFTLVTGFLLTWCGGAQSGQTTVLKGSLLPQDQGWSVSTNAVTPLDVGTNGSTVTLNTIGVLRSFDQLPGKALCGFIRKFLLTSIRDSQSSSR